MTSPRSSTPNMFQGGSSSRRCFLQGGVLVLSGFSWGANTLLSNDRTEGIRIGLVTDLHYADEVPAGTRHYRETLAKLEEAAEAFRKADVDFIVELGDLIDAADSVDVELGYLRTVNRDFAQICSQRHYVLGNHCVDMLTKQEFLSEVEQEKSYYSFDQAGLHFIVLDSCYRSDYQPYGRKNFEWTDANVPPEELEWLKADLQSNDKPAIVFAHQRLDVSDNHGVKNNAEVRQVLETSGRVLAVFQGHSHQNALTEIGGIPYCTLVAMVEGSGQESSGYSILEITPEGTLKLQGFRKQETRSW